MANRSSLIYKPDIDFEKELLEAAVNLRGTVAPADYVPKKLAQLCPAPTLPALSVAALRTAPAF